MYYKISEEDLFDLTKSNYKFLEKENQDNQTETQNNQNEQKEVFPVQGWIVTLKEEEEEDEDFL